MTQAEREVPRARTSGPNQVFWADAEARSLPTGNAHVIRDSKTPSGSVPISSLRGPIITDALYRTFKAHGLEVRYVFTIDDYDPMDSQTMRQQEGMAEHMGKPFWAIPSPDPSYSDFARYHASLFLSTFTDVGIHPEEIHWMRDLYRDGRLDRQIDLVLRNAETIRAIHERVANVHHGQGWLPISVICQRCGRIGTTMATDYDGETVAYECRVGYVEWAEGCGDRGRVSPFRGNAKLLWNEQWCAMWDHFGVTYEEGGKDLLTAGGSRERSNEIYRQVWKKEPPVGLMHEFLLIGGRKMATSKGLGARAVDLVEIYPGELIRFLMLRTHPRRTIEFDPAGMTLPRLVDEYDRCADAYIADPASDLGKVWALSQLSSEPEPIAFRVRFGLIADWLQIPSIRPEREAEARKRSPLNERESRDLARRIALAKVWLERWAPEEARFSVKEELPAGVRKLNERQRAFLGRLSAELDGHGDPEKLQTRLYDLAKEVGLGAEGKVSRDAFVSVYVALLGKDSGPRAAWLLLALPRDFVKRRLAEAARSAED